MCLSTVNFALVWDKNKRDYIGEGYKVMGTFTLAKYKNKKWKTAQGNLDNKAENINKTTIRGLDYNSYIPGFHIFLNKEDAAAYRTTQTLVKVQYKGVLAFGKNKAGSRVPGPCVIAKYMKVVGEIER